MLNRLFIAVGVLVILVIGSAFVVPSFVNWGAFRTDLGTFASDVMGEPVSIAGDVKFTLLPQPRLQFADVKVGAEYQPTLSAQSVVADLSLFDLLRGRYTVTQLKVVRPEAYIHIRSDGQIETGLSLAARPGMQSVSIAVADIEAGQLLVSDDRSGDSAVLGDLTGLLKLEGLQGPFMFQGAGVIDGVRYGLRVASGKIAPDTPVEVAASLRATETGFSVSTEGVLTLGDNPRYSGNMIYRQPPPPDSGDVGRGDFVMTSKVDADPANVVFGDYTVIPDENRTTARLVGAASIKLGVDMSFNIAVTGGQMALPPRDATKETGPVPYELVRTLGELPAPLLPPIPGTLTLSVSQVDMRGTPLRDVRLDASLAERAWTVQTFTGMLPGGTVLKLSGVATAEAGRPAFKGTLGLKSNRLDLLSTMWRKPAPGNPLFNVPGEVSAALELKGDRLALSGGKLTLDGEVRPFSATLGLEGARVLDLTADLGDLDANRSAALAALSPEYAPGSPMLATFGAGTFDLSAGRFTLAGLDGRDAVAKGGWDEKGIEVSVLTVADVGGVGLHFDGRLSGSPEHPAADGMLTVDLNDKGAAGLEAAYAALGLKPAIRDAIGRLAPAQVTLRSGPLQPDGAAIVELGGTAGPATISGSIRLAKGLRGGMGSDDVLSFGLVSDNPDALVSRLGLGDAGLLGPDGNASFTAEFKGDPAGSVSARLRLEQGSQSLKFDGSLDFTDPDAASGKGNIVATLDDGAALATLAGADGLSLPAFTGSADLEFVAGRKLSLKGIKGTSGGAGFAGALDILVADSGPIAMGEMALDSVDTTGLWRLLAGPAAQLPGTAGVWPEGQIALGDVSRDTTGRIKVTAKGLTVGGTERFGETSFDLVWDRTNLRLREFIAHLGDGTVKLDATLCCAGPTGAKTLTGRVAVAGLPIAAVLPDAAQSGITGTLVDFSAQVSATGANAAEMAASMTGDGTYSIGNLTISGLEPAGLAIIPDLASLEDRQEEDVRTDIYTALALGPFVAGPVTGSFGIINGTLRAPAIAATGQGGRLFGGGTLRLPDLALGGSFELTADKGLSIPGADPSVTLMPAGTLLAPARSLDSAAYVSALTAQAATEKIERLETLQREDDARLKAEAEERARIEAEQKRQAEEAAAKKLAADAAKAKADEAARRQKALELTQPLDLGLGQ